MGEDVSIGFAPVLSVGAGVGVSDVIVGVGVGVGVVGVRTTTRSQIVGAPLSGDKVQVKPLRVPLTMPPTWFDRLAAVNPDSTAV